MSKPATFMGEHAKRWLGDNTHVWRDYFLIGKIHYLNNHQKEALPFLTQAKHLVKVEKLT